MGELATATDWEAMRSLAAVLSAVCAIVAATVSVMLYRKARSSDLGSKIEVGDKSVREHADKTVAAMREANAAAIAKIEATCAHLTEQVDEVCDSVARIEARQENEEQHVLRPVDLGKVHDRINKVAEELAATRAQSTTETKMLYEQLKVIQQILMQSMRPNT